MKYITTPIYYINGTPHIGHLYTTIAADVYTRYWRSRGEEVFFQTGTDEHGQKVLDKAKELSQDINEYVDSLAASWEEFWNHSGIEYDKFIRTTDSDHETYVSERLQELFDRGLIYEGVYAGWYDKREERFWTDKDIENGLSPNGNPVERIEEKNYFFNLEAFRSQIRQHIEENEDFIRPWGHRNKVLRELEQPLKPLCISRPKARLSWGIELPFDSDYVTYVWFDALLNYVSTVPEDYIESCIHLIGKDILIFHTIYWPAILLAIGKPLPRQIFAHGWWLDVSGEKVGKSVGNALDPDYLTERFGKDALRVLLLHTATFGADGKFWEQRFIGEYNTLLSNSLGNLVNRTFGMARKYCNGKVPAFNLEYQTEVDTSFAEELTVLTAEYHRLFEDEELQFRFKQIVDVIYEVSIEGNGYIHDREPWNLSQEEKNNVVYQLLLCVRILADLLEPFCPDKSAEILSSFTNGLEPGSELKPCPPLFPRIYEE